MSIDERFASLLPQPDPAPGQLQGLLPAPPSPPSALGVLGVPGDPASLFAPPFDPMQVAGGWGLANSPSPLDGSGWLRALQALHDSLGGASQLAPPGADPTANMAAYRPTLTDAQPPASSKLSPPDPATGHGPPPTPSAAHTGDGDPAVSHGAPGVRVFQPGDQNLLARLIFAETGEIPDDAAAVGWATINEMRPDQTLNNVLQRRNGFQSLQAGGGPVGGSPQWQASADPSKLTDGDAKSWAAAQNAAAGIIDGSIPDPTGGATQFFASSDYDPKDSKSAPGDFRRMLREQTIKPSTYGGHAYGTNRNYFFVNK
jgi:hypothetical protein